MDWSSDEGRALLWQAYPDGYLAMRGVRTVDGWSCVLFRPSNYGEAWEIVPGDPPGAQADLSVELPVLYGDVHWWQEMQRECHYDDYTHATLDPAEALIRVRISLRASA